MKALLIKNYLTYKVTLLVVLLSTRMVLAQECFGVINNSELTSDNFKVVDTKRAGNQLIFLPLQRFCAIGNFPYS